MIGYGIALIVFAGIAEHFKDLSEEGKLNGYWSKNTHPMVYVGKRWIIARFEEHHYLWWKVHWLQGGIWDYTPVWVRQYSSFRDGWHLLKFVSLNAYAIGVVIIFGADWWWYFVLRFAFSSPETVLRFLRKKY